MPADAGSRVVYPGWMQFDTPDSDDRRVTLDAGTRMAPTAEVDGGARDGGAIAAPISPLDFPHRYRQEAVLGQGGMGVVALCGDQQIWRRVAMKRLQPHRLGHSEAETRFLREARIQGQLEHPAVVPVYDLGVDPDGAMYFTMKRVRGATLEQVIDDLRQGRGADYSRRRLLAAFSSVCLAVDFAHRRGVVHRDLKPGNIMLGDYGEVYVLDWGLARVLGATDLPIERGASAVIAGPRTSETRAGAVLGTPGYMAPEQMRGELSDVGPRADVYSLGVILFEMLTQRPLHEGETIQEVMSSTLAGVESRPSLRAPESDVPPELEEIVVRATALDPGQRFQSARALNEAIERFEDGERDVELRRSMARRHAKSAGEAADRARSEWSPGFEERRRAMREIGRALALDPDNTTAMETLVRLLAEPPRVLPPEVQMELDRNDRDKLRWIGKIGGFAYLSLFGYLPLLWWGGVRQWGWLVAMYVAAVCASGVSFWTASRRSPPVWGVLLVMVVSNIAFACTAALFGPLVVTPGIIAVNTTGFALNLDPAYRRFAVATACLTILGVLAVWAGGMLPGDYVFSSAGLTVTPGAIELPRIPTLLFLVVISLGMVVTGALSVTRVRDALKRSETQLFLYAWHLREFVPAAVRPTTDPTAARREAAPAAEA